MADDLQARVRVLQKRRDKIDTEINAINGQLYEERQAARCQAGLYSNRPCLLVRGHEGPHRYPCTDRMSHGRHADHGENWYTECQGRVFDAT